jgi:hypothetical protein
MLAHTKLQTRPAGGREGGVGRTPLALRHLKRELILGGDAPDR